MTVWCAFQVDDWQRVFDVVLAHHDEGRLSWPSLLKVELYSYSRYGSSGFCGVIVEKTSSFNFWQRNEYPSIFSALFTQFVHMVLFLAAYVVPPWLLTIMSSICYQFIGSFADISALIRVNDVSPYSSMSLSFLLCDSALVCVSPHAHLCMSHPHPTLHIPQLNAVTHQTCLVVRTWLYCSSPQMSLIIFSTPSCIVPIFL